VTVLVTGAGGFLGRNLCVALAGRDDIALVRFDVEQTAADLSRALDDADVVFHLAGVNRPPNPDEFHAVNAGLTAEICDALIARRRRPKIVLASSIQATLDNPYGRSKRAAEEAVLAYTEASGAPAVVYRLFNLFGKWCRPNYNSVTATFCHNIAHGLPIQISDPATEITLTYVDDVVAAFCGELADAAPGFRLAPPLPSHTTTLGELAELIQSFPAQRHSLLLPDFSSSFVRSLYATYLSYLATDDFAYPLQIKSDMRGSLAEFLKARGAGQLFVSRTKSGVTRGNHFHHTKTEKFLVVEGQAVIRLRAVDGGGRVIEYRVSGADFRVVDIPPGYAHSIENVGPGEMVTLFWASEVFDPERPDTYAMPALPDGAAP
jgi:UDP-2-acetamido-2,6-beta-L-arabino-hexul-4-ose reductase